MQINLQKNYFFTRLQTFKHFFCTYQNFFVPLQSICKRTTIYSTSLFILTL